MSLQKGNQKICPKCSTDKPLSAFSKNKSRKDGLNGWCKSCLYGPCSDAQKKDKTGNRNKLLKSRYGIDIQDFNTMFLKQEGKCGICGKHQGQLSRTLSVDHDHATGKVRELLCDLCNRAIGYLKEDENLLLAAIEYLRRHHGVTEG